VVFRGHLDGEEVVGLYPTVEHDSLSQRGSAFECSSSDPDLLIMETEASSPPPPLPSAFLVNESPDCSPLPSAFIKTAEGRGSEQ